MLEPLFQMMDEKLFGGRLLSALGGDGNALPGGSKDKRFMLSSGTTSSDKDTSILINLCSKNCKTIMRKLSVTHDTEFRGSILKFIAGVFPLTHPSGLNKMGAFNVKNITQIECSEEVKEKDLSQQP